MTAEVVLIWDVKTQHELVSHIWFPPTQPPSSLPGIWKVHKLPRFQLCWSPSRLSQGQGLAQGLHQQVHSTLILLHASPSIIPPVHVSMHFDQLCAFSVICCVNSLEPFSLTKTLVCVYKILTSHPSSQVISKSSMNPFLTVPFLKSLFSPNHPLVLDVWIALLTAHPHFFYFILFERQSQKEKRETDRDCDRESWFIVRWLNLRAGTTIQVSHMGARMRLPRACRWFEEV